MNIAVIFAGGTGSRMNSKNAKPKQFLDMQGKPIIIHTIEKFEKHKNIDAIVVSCIEEWIIYLEALLNKFNIKKVKKIVHGGATGQLSIFNGLEAAEQITDTKKNIVLIHDGVRPLINSKTISDNIQSVKKYGSAITGVKAKETVMIASEANEIEYIPDREISWLVRAPQSFWLDDILKVHRQSLSKGMDNFIDSCTLMQYFEKKMCLVEGPYENIKITTPEDFYIMRALLDAHENAQIYGYME